MKEAYSVEIEYLNENNEECTICKPIVVVATDFIHIKRKVTHYMKVSKLPTDFNVVSISRLTDGTGNVV